MSDLLSFLLLFWPITDRLAIIDEAESVSVFEPSLVNRIQDCNNGDSGYLEADHPEGKVRLVYSVRLYWHQARWVVYEEKAGSVFIDGAEDCEAIEAQ